MKLSLVIVNFHSSAYVEQSLAAVDASWCERVVIVDNSNDQDEAARLDAIALPVPRDLVVEPSNLGFGAAANDGINAALRQSPNEPVWLVNPDTTYPSTTPEALIDRLKLDLDDIVSPIVVTGAVGDEQVWFAGGSVDPLTGQVVHDGYLSAYQRGTLPASRTSTFICGAAPVFTPAAWRTLGGFREDLFLYWEDAELSLRAQDARLRMTVVNTKAPVWHAVGGTGEGHGQSNAFYFYSARNRVLVMIERGHTFDLVRPRTVLQLAKFALRPLRNETSQQLTKMLSVLHGYAVGTRLGRSDARRGYHK